MRSSSGQSVAPGIAASDQRQRSCSRPGGRPSTDAMTRMGNGTARASTTSTGAPVGRASSSAVAVDRTAGSSDRTTEGRKPGATKVR